MIGAITHSVANANCEPIQVQVMDATKCFDKLWLQSCINSLYEAGVDNDYLNLLYMENRNANIAVKINNQLSTRISVKDVVMQGSVWGSLKCTTSMDTMNKTAISDKTLQYLYRGDPNIPVGVLGMIDDTLAITKCGKEAIRKNAFINSFIETHRLTLSKEKSVVLHFGKENKCCLPCPDLRVHKDSMKKTSSTKYLGNVLSTTGGQSDNIEDRRNRGWGKVSTIIGILSEVDMGLHKLEAGLMLRQAILISSMLCSAEAWSGITDKQLARLEVVDSSLLRRLTGGHVKCATESLHLETGTWKLRHHLTYLRLMYHHHILTREDNETIKKIYIKQTNNNIKGDWFQLLVKDFEFIKTEMNEKEISDMSKDMYKKVVKDLINKAVFEFLMNQKQTHKKIDEVEYSRLETQPYLTTNTLKTAEKELLFNMRSKCHKSKINFKRLYKNNLQCSLGCVQPEDQRHTFTTCLKIPNNYPNATYEDIFGTLANQEQAIQIFNKIDLSRKHTQKNHILPGRERRLPGLMHTQFIVWCSKCLIAIAFVVDLIKKKGYIT